MVLNDDHQVQRRRRQYNLTLCNIRVLDTHFSKVLNSFTKNKYLHGIPQALFLLFFINLTPNNACHVTSLFLYPLKTLETESSRSQMLCKIGVLKIFAIIFGLQTCNVIKETPKQVFSYEHCEIFLKFFLQNTAVVPSIENPSPTLHR